MATNALALEDYYDLKSGGGPAFRSLSIAMFSALLRTACLTVPSWREWCRQLNVAAMQCLPRERWTNGLQYPEFWDSPAFVCNLQSAYQCFVTKPKLRIGALAALHEVCNGPPPFDPKQFPPYPDFQALAYSKLLAASFSTDSLQKTIYKRVRDLFIPYEIEGTGVDLSAALTIMKKRLRKHGVMRVIKTWCNSWGTSARMHERIRLPCLLGCQEAEDHMAHYVQCPFWLYLLSKLLPDPLPSPLPLTRLGVVDPSITSLLALSCSFAGYHAIKRLAREKYFTEAPLTPALVSLCHKTFFDAFSAAALDCSLPCTALSSLLQLTD